MPSLCSGGLATDHRSWLAFEHNCTLGLKPVRAVREHVTSAKDCVRW